MMNAEFTRSGRFVVPTAVAVAIAVAGIASAAQPNAEDVVLTAVQGETSVADTTLIERREIREDEKLTTGEDGGCSVLIDRNAVVELCGLSQVTFTRNTTVGNRIVNIEAGEVRLIVEPREPGERIEIHTPAAVATILGTVVYVSVDPVTGATTISSSQSQVNIKQKGDTSDTGTTIDAFEQLTLVPGEAKQAKKKITKQQIDAMGSCLGDFHDIAVNVDRIPQEGKVLERVVATETVPSVEAGPEILIITADPDPPENDDIITVVEANEVEEMMPPPEMEPEPERPPIGGIPGEQF
jgi:hypothetical protein